MGELNPVDPNTGATIAKGSRTAAQIAAAAQENRVGDNELVPLGLKAPPAGSTNADMAALSGYVTQESMPTRY